MTIEQCFFFFNHFTKCKSVKPLRQSGFLSDKERETNINNKDKIKKNREDSS